MDRPTIFLSSTVYDFADLRSALKDYLELRGCRVLASEFTDFTRPLDAHSYDACLKTIEQADLFVLFIGRRVGGWLDASNKVSITRAEYRHAYELAKESRTRLLCFVRSEVYDHRQSVRDLEKALKADPSLNEDQRERLRNHPTMAMENAEAIISFIDEVTKNSETVAASKGAGSAPIANWISPFATFTQVRQALDPLIAHGLTVSQAAGRKALEVQLVRLLRQMVPLISGEPCNPVNSVISLVKEIDIGVESLLEDVLLAPKVWSRLLTLITLCSRRSVDHTSLLPALSSDLLLQYDPARGTFEQTEEYELLVRVVEQARIVGGPFEADLLSLFRHGKAIDAQGTRRIPARLVVNALHHLLRWTDLIGSARALAASLSGHEYRNPPEIPLSPVSKQESQLASETASLDSIRDFVLKWARPA